MDDDSRRAVGLPGAGPTPEDFADELMAARDAAIRVVGRARVGSLIPISG
jgi:hypothetical protein